MLSDRFVRNAKPGTYADGGGLYLRVLATTKTFVWRRRVNGKDVWESLGRYPAMGLASARERLERMQSGQVFMSVNDAYKEYFKYLSKHFVRPEQVDRMFQKDVLPRVGCSELATVTQAMWVDLAQRVVKRGAPVMANRLLTQVKKFVDYCEQRGWVDNNPIEKVKRRAVGGRETPKDRNLSLDEITAFVGVLKASGCSEGTKWALIGCLLTGLRASEVLSVTDDGRAFTKMQRWHQVPLTPLVKLWLKNRPAELPKDHRVLSHALRREKQTFTPHDLRRTFASRLADLGVAPHVIEKMLDHKMIGVMAVYNRAEYHNERLAAQKLWDRKLRKIRNPAEAGSVSLG